MDNKHNNTLENEKQADLGFWFSGSEHVGFRQPGLWMHENSLNNWKSFNFKWQGGSLEVLKNLISYFASQQLLTHKTKDENQESKDESQELKDDVRVFLYERIISIYMKSRQKSWRKFNDLIPEKGTSSLCENLKAFYNDTQTLPKSENKFSSIKKANIPQDLLLVSELQWLLWVFGNNINAKIKQKKNLIPLIFDHLKKETQFCEEAMLKRQMFTS
ncbi:hypothetical protein GLOIN_2v1762741 [Rhizophagus irregularis DAOM 181602=DAOM 197198]|uniref:Uncharacterized protein n=1 Tax=Rhizophagus irregularis (strain DAOM 181602 / DAOM 197198 / MUCL 43194) TaxID=747089 RepID=A0A2P4QW51_RHIID|nr:hypothetical protein GLOIN_2v1762741 [Rhizophagus irregularis DAOM 181602=DAOM 197198]POG81859.1 hypothetical protein GLOIN_2v1762741 [Rhizophagus irregularis DAOM 181602=DAOM 197198]|eukprot:XP_025188725.1 hypothetical protein GLOIN_2v1762741 [Rhizophagus irregularis DAOM 181602=DAOM 197198]